MTERAACRAFEHELIKLRLLGGVKHMYLNSWLYDSGVARVFAVVSDGYHVQLMTLGYDKCDKRPTDRIRLRVTMRSAGEAVAVFGRLRDLADTGDVKAIEATCARLRAPQEETRLRHSEEERLVARLHLEETQAVEKSVIAAVLGLVSS